MRRRSFLARVFGVVAALPLIRWWWRRTEEPASPAPGEMFIACDPASGGVGS